MVLGNLIYYILILFIPVVFTFWNIKRFTEEVPPEKEKNEYVFDIFFIVGGLVLCDMMISAGNYANSMGADWYIAIYEGFNHTWLNNEYKFSVYLLIILGAIGFMVLCTGEPDNTPPLVSAIAIALNCIGIVTGLFYILQLMKNYNVLFCFVVCHWVNYVLVSAKRIRRHIIGHVRITNERQTVYRSRLAFKLAEIMSKISTMSAYCFLMIVPVAVVLEIIFIIIGQGADGVIKAFTETADWTFSQQIPPPPIEGEPYGHYLCTVAAGGHKKVVKPLRYGKRCGKIIIVNRQLLTANAFEDLIAEKTPKFHRAIRTFYNKYGYPISKHITNKLRADIVYILMKPLEWIFLVTLYFFDTHPENRIAIQYSDYKKGETKS